MTDSIHWMCRVGWHKWSRWTDPKEGTAFGVVTRQGVKIRDIEIDVTIQTRSCNSCGEFEKRLSKLDGHII